MRRYLHDLIIHRAATASESYALKAGSKTISYGELSISLSSFAAGLSRADIKRFDRIAIYLDKRLEAVIAMFGAAMAGSIFVPCNPVLKPPQIGHILHDCNAKVLISSRSRIEALAEVIAGSDIRLIICVDDLPKQDFQGISVIQWADFMQDGWSSSQSPAPFGPLCDTDVAAIFYTSGSTGKPKGVVLSHRNLVVGGESVAEYLKNTAKDRILSLLPLSFDAGFSQLTTGFAVGALVVLHNYLLPRQVPAICAKERITGLTCVPPLWMQLLQADWPAEATRSMRYFANTGGRMPRDVLSKLRSLFDNADPYLMYGLTEAFRSTYLEPSLVDERPDSIGKAIPNAEILVVKPDGTLAGAGEEGELVHRGPLVALGYWNDKKRTDERFKPAPTVLEAVQVPETAVWSGDIVQIDEDGFLYFVGRTDDMIKTSGYRVSPTEVEEAMFETGLVREAAAFGVAHKVLGQEIVVAVVPTDAADFSEEDLIARCRATLPGYMVPAAVDIRSALPRSPNGKIDRKALAAQIADQRVEAAQ